MKILIIVIIIFIIISVIISIAIRYYLKQVITRPIKSYECLLNDQYKKGVIEKGYYESLNKEKITLISTDGLKLKGVFVEGDKDVNKTMVFVHGITAGIPTSLKYMKMFLDKGWNILMYDQRRHGKSEGKYSTFGYYEKEDLDLFVNWVVRRKGIEEIIGLHGESMGAATVLQYAEINKYVKFIISDCAYSDMNELLRFRMKEDVILPLSFLFKLTDLRIRKIAKFDISDVSPIEAVKKSEIPMLFIHGKEDKFVPTYMSEKMYEVKKGLKSIYLCDGAKHACSIHVNRKKYEKVVFEFISEVFQKQS